MGCLIVAGEGYVAATTRPFAWANIVATVRDPITNFIHGHTANFLAVYWNSHIFHPIRYVEVLHEGVLPRLL